MPSFGSNVSLSPATSLAKDVVVGNNVSFHGPVIVESGTRIFDGAVLGRPPATAGNTTRPVSRDESPLHIGSGCIIGANAVLYTGSSYGDRVLIGDLASIREGCRIGEDVVIGRGTMVMYDSVIRARTRVIDNAIITGAALIEEDVFIGPGANSVNDNQIYLKRFGLVEGVWKGPVVRRFAVIGAGACLSGGVEVGRGALVAPGAVITRNVEPWTIVAGVPGRKLRDVDESDRRRILDHFGEIE